MNLKQLQFVAHVADTQSFSRAAELSFVTQPTLSNGISQLEGELGGRLFKRTTRMVELTAFGEFMLPRIREMLQNRNELLAAAESFHNPSHKLLRIGFSPLVDMGRLTHALDSYRAQFPEVELFFKECFIDELSERLEKGQIDIQIVPDSAHNARDWSLEQSHFAAVRETGKDISKESCLTFYQDRLYYLPAANQSLGSDHLAYELTDLPETPVIMTGGGCGLNAALEQLFANQGLRLPTYPGQALSYGVIEDWASLGIGAGILPKAKISTESKTVLPLFLSKEQPAYFNFDWVWREDSAMPEHLVAFIHYIQQLPDPAATEIVTESCNN